MSEIRENEYDLWPEPPHICLSLCGNVSGQGLPLYEGVISTNRASIKQSAKSGVDGGK